MQTIKINSQLIQSEASRLGFTTCGFAKAEPVDEETEQIYDKWISCGFHADMGYMKRNRELRLDPTLLMPGCRTLIITALNYYPKQQIPKENYQIAYYAYGADYHRVVKDKLHQLLYYIKTLVPQAKGRAFCDTAPLLERYWAVKAGLGFIGRNRQLIIPGHGSYFFLGALAIDVEVEEEIKKNINVTGCLNCNRCIRACPTGALTIDGIDCRHCLSYLTIEHQGAISPHFIDKIGRRIYGCDTCQQVCPYNKEATPTTEVAFALPAEINAMTELDWQNITPESYKRLFRNSAIERAGYEGLKRNIEAVIAGTREKE